MAGIIYTTSGTRMDLSKYNLGPLTGPQTDPDMPPLEWYNFTDALSNYTHVFNFETNWDRIQYYFWFRRTWWYCYLGALLYVLAVHVGQKLMTYRSRGFELRTVLVLWNAGSAVFSIVGFVRTSNEVFRVLSRHGFEHSVCIASYSQDHVFLFWIKAFIFSKYFEFIDTMFLILRKREVTFLHWYHHMTVLLFCWDGVYHLTAAGRWFCWMNYGVHTVLYTYFAWRSMGYGCPKFVSMLITCCQMSQMVVGCFIGVAVYRTKVANRPCHQTWYNLYMGIAIYSTFFLLFCRYFYKTYVSAKATDKWRKPLQSNGAHKSRQESLTNGHSAQTNGYHQDYIDAKASATGVRSRNINNFRQAS